MRNGKKNKRKRHKSMVSPLRSPAKVVSLMSTNVSIGNTFLGYKTKNINQLWRWDDLSDVVFK